MVYNTIGIIIYDLYTTPDSLDKTQVFGCIVLIILVTIGTTILSVKPTFGVKGATGIDRGGSSFADLVGDMIEKAPLAITGDNVYTAWWTA